VKRCPTPQRGRTLQADPSAAILEQQQLENPSATSPLSQACSARSGHMLPHTSAPAYICVLPARQTRVLKLPAGRVRCLRSAWCTTSSPTTPSAGAVQRSAVQCAQSQPHHAAPLPCIIALAHTPAAPRLCCGPSQTWTTVRKSRQPPLFPLRHRPRRQLHAQSQSAVSCHILTRVQASWCRGRRWHPGPLLPCHNRPHHPPTLCPSLAIPASSAALGQSLLERLITSRSSPNASSTSASASSSAAASKSLPPLKPAPAPASKFNFSADAAPQSRCTLHRASPATCRPPPNGDTGPLPSSTVPVESQQPRSPMRSRLTRMGGRRRA
jgi:hypothetical protein